jgi:uncharacterized protein
VSEWWEGDLERPVAVAVPYTELSVEALRGVVESFVLREGTDYGEQDVSHETKIVEVMRQLQRGEAEIRSRWILRDGVVVEAAVDRGGRCCCPSGRGLAPVRHTCREAEGCAEVDQCVERQQIESTSHQVAEPFSRSCVAVSEVSGRRGVMAPLW